MKDILQNKSLKQQPYSTPEGYFESLKAGLKMIPARERFTPWRRYAGIAAAAAILLTAGGFIAGRLTGRAEFPEEYASEQYAAAQDITEDDLIEYLIYTGVEIEEIEEL